jgi:hypothetical protein
MQRLGITSGVIIGKKQDIHSLQSMHRFVLKISHYFFGEGAKAAALPLRTPPGEEANGSN